MLDREISPLTSILAAELGTNPSEGIFKLIAQVSFQFFQFFTFFKLTFSDYYPLLKRLQI